MRDTPLLVVSPDTSVASAVAQMRERRYSCTLVNEAGKLVGIFTERDYLNRICGAPHGPDSSVGEVMTRDPDTLYADDDVAYAINLMATADHRTIPIVDVRGRPIGVYTISDVLAHLGEVFEGIEEREVPWDQFEEWIDIGVGD